MLGIFLLLILLAIAGAIYARITGVVAKHEISIFRGAVVVVGAGVVAGLARMLIPVPYVGSPLFFAAMTLMGMAIADLPWKLSMIIAAVYTVLGLILDIALAWMGSGAVPAS